MFSNNIYVSHNKIGFKFLIDTIPIGPGLFNTKHYAIGALAKEDEDTCDT